MTGARTTAGTAEREATRKAIRDAVDLIAKTYHFAPR
jgi:hypothetical protein